MPISVDITSNPNQTRRQSFRSPSSGLKPFVLWHLLSLDAPTVAVSWTIFSAAVTHTLLPPATPAAMALAVWILYAADRLLDSRCLGHPDATASSTGLEPRHLFHHRHRHLFAAAICVCGLGLVVLLRLLPVAALRLYVIEGAVLATYFLLIHTGRDSIFKSWRSPRSPSRRLPKEMLVGVFFATAVFIPIAARNPGSWAIFLPLPVLFAALCSLNCFYIYAWEHPDAADAHWTTRQSIRRLPTLTGLLILLSSLSFFRFGLSGHPSMPFALFSLACSTSGLLLLAIHTLRLRLSPIALRASADAALLTPLLALPCLLLSRASA